MNSGIESVFIDNLQVVFISSVRNIDILFPGSVLYVSRTEKFKKKFVFSLKVQIGGIIQLFALFCVVTCTCCVSKKQR